MLEEELGSSQASVGSCNVDCWDDERIRTLMLLVCRAFIITFICTACICICICISDNAILLLVCDFYKSKYKYDKIIIYIT